MPKKCSLESQLVLYLCSSLRATNHDWIPNSLIIDYIKNNGQRWKVCLGVPYDTSLWQVGDSAKNNDTFQVEFYCAKNDLLVWKYERGPTQSIDTTDLIPLLNIAFPVAFVQVDCNLSAVA